MNRVDQFLRSPDEYPMLIERELRRQAIHCAQKEQHYYRTTGDEYTAEQQHDLADQIFSHVLFENHCAQDVHPYYTLEGLFEQYCQIIEGRQSRDEEIEDYLNFFLLEFRRNRFRELQLRDILDD